MNVAVAATVMGQAGLRSGRGPTCEIWKVCLFNEYRRQRQGARDKSLRLRRRDADEEIGWMAQEVKQQAIVGCKKREEAALHLNREKVLMGVAPVCDNSTAATRRNSSGWRTGARKAEEVVV